jgi:hypothetical protein
MTELKPPPPPAPVELLILGAGWTSTFLIPLLRAQSVSYAATQRAPAPGSDNIPFAFDPEGTDALPFTALPAARTVLITFPIKLAGASARLVEFYGKTHPEARDVLFVQLGSTGIWDVCADPLLWVYMSG